MKTAYFIFVAIGVAACMVALLCVPESFHKITVSHIGLAASIVGFFAVVGMVICALLDNKQ